MMQPILVIIGLLGGAFAGVSRLTSGTSSSTTSISYQVSLFDVADPGKPVLACGGAIVDAYWVVTAGGCIDGDTTADTSCRYVIGYGSETAVDFVWTTFNGGNPGFAVADTGGCTNTPTTPNHRCVVPFRHPLYDAGTKKYDFALLYVPDGIPLGPGVAPIALSTRLEVPKNTPLTISGWGAKPGKERRNAGVWWTSQNVVLQAATVWTVRTADFEEPRWWSAIEVYGRLSGACPADTGGPMVSRDAGGTAVLEGVLSYGRGGGCGSPSSP